MLLGDLLSRLSDESVATETILGFCDIALIANFRERAAANGQSLGAYTGGAVRRYAAEASDEEWVTLMGALSAAKDPGLVLMQRAFEYILKRDH
jgi:predicted HTH transcriptional regulator